MLWQDRLWAISQVRGGPACGFEHRFDQAGRLLLVFLGQFRAMMLVTFGFFDALEDRSAKFVRTGAPTAAQPGPVTALAAALQLATLAHERLELPASSSEPQNALSAAQAVLERKKSGDNAFSVDKWP